MKKKKTDFNAYALTVLSDPDAYKYVKGIGYQWAGKYGIQRTVESFPELRYMQTENECGDGTNTWDYAQYVYGLYQHYFTNGVNAYIYWNIALEPKGRSTWGWEQNSMITVGSSGEEAVFNPEYFVMKHFSHFVTPGSVRIGLKGHWTGNALAFKTPEGHTVITLMNPFTVGKNLQLSDGHNVYSFLLEPESFHTIVFRGE